MQSKMDKEQIVSNGILLEINRQLLHPRGLSAVVDDDGKLSITDLRQTDEGKSSSVRYNFEAMPPEDFGDFLRQLDSFESLMSPAREELRIRQLNYIIEPVRQL